MNLIKLGFKIGAAFAACEIGYSMTKTICKIPARFMVKVGLKMLEDGEDTEVKEEVENDD